MTSNPYIGVTHHGNPNRRLPVVLAASILSADFTRLGEVERVIAGGADWIHFDVMDNHYVPNLTIGPMVCQALRTRGIRAPINVHLMVEPVDALARHVDRSLQVIRDAGCQAGLLFNPAASLEAVRDVLDKIDIVLLMSVNLGFGGQSFIPSAYAKLAEARALIDDYRARCGRAIRLQVDGGVKIDNIARIAAAGAATFVAVRRSSKPRTMRQPSARCVKRSSTTNRCRALVGRKRSDDLLRSEHRGGRNAAGRRRSDKTVETATSSL